MLNKAKQHKINEWIMITFIVLLVGLIVQPAYAYSQVAPWVTYPYDKSNNYGATGFREFIELNNTDRIRQNGTITQLKFWVANPAVLGVFNYTIWRKNSTGATLYDRISLTNISNIQTIVAGMNTVNVNIPVREGDFYGFSFSVIGGGLQQPFQVSASGHTTNLTASGVLVYDNQIYGYNWGGAGISTASNGYVIEAYMDSTYSVWIGDSLIAGHPDHYSYIEEKTQSNISNTTENHWFNQVNSSYLYPAYQNMGIGGNQTTDIRARLYHDLINKSPAFGFLEGGVNDVSGGVVSDATILSNWNQTIRETFTNGTTPVIILILPWTAGSNAQMQRIDYLNKEIEKIALNYTPSIVINSSCVIGVNRVGGDAGNCWDINPIYDSGDGTHLKSEGYNALATAIKNNFTNIYFKVGLHNYINKSGWIVYSGTLNQSTRVNATIIPTTGFIDVVVTDWGTSGNYRKVLTVSSNTASNPTTFTIRELPANTKLSLKVNGVQSSTPTTDSTGSITFTYTGGFSSITIDISVLALEALDTNWCNPYESSPYGALQFGTILTFVVGAALLFYGFREANFTLMIVGVAVIVGSIIALSIGAAIISRMLICQ